MNQGENFNGNNSQQSMPNNYENMNQPQMQPMPNNYANMGQPQMQQMPNSYGNINQPQMQQMPNNYGNMNQPQMQQMPNNYVNMNQPQMQPIPNNLNYTVIVKWAFSVILVLWGFLNVFSISTNGLYLLNTLLSLGAATLICPLLEEKLKGIKLKWAIAAGMVLLEIVIYFIIGMSL